MDRLPLALVGLIALALASPARADRAEEGKKLVDEWLRVQNQGDFAGYQRLYAKDFRGVRKSGAKSVKLDREGWLRDRERMFKKPMVVSAKELQLDWYGSYLEVELEQTWSSGSYRDVGHKRMEVVEEEGAWRIRREELVSSTRILGPGEIVEVFLPAKDADAASKAFEELVDLLPVTGWELETTERGVKIAACDKDGPLIGQVAQALDPRVTVRVVKGKPAASCPAPRWDPDGGRTYRWPEIARATVRKRTITLLLWTYDGADQGDFGRAYEGFDYVALYHEASGALIRSHIGTSATDFSQLEKIDAGPTGLTIDEQYVDDPCDGTNKHRYKEISRTTTIDPSPKQPDALRVETADATVKRDRCSDEEYRQWQRDMERAE